MQDIFIKIYKYYEGFKGDAKLSTWIYRICVNACIARASAKKKNIDYFNEDVEIKYKNVLEKIETPEELFQKEELKEIILRMVSKLEPMYSSIITLYYFEEKSYREISEILEIPMGTVSIHLYRARNLLKEMIIKKLNLINLI